MVTQVGLEQRVGEEEQLAGAGVEARVRRHRTYQLAVEVELANRVERGGDLGGHAAFPEGQQSPGMADDVGVGRVLDRSGVAGELAAGKVHHLGQPAVHGLTVAQFGAQALGANPAVLVGHSVVAERDAVQHAVAVKHVVAAERLEHGVGPIANEGAAKSGRDGAVDVAPVDGEFLGRWHEVAAQVGLVGGVDHRGRQRCDVGHDQQVNAVNQPVSAVLFRVAVSQAEVRRAPVSACTLVSRLSQRTVTPSRSGLSASRWPSCRPCCFELRCLRQRCVELQ